MRGILENCEEKEISLSEELKMLEFYMDLESLRFKNKFNYEVKIADDINPENTLIPPMILQPFVENSILHGLAKKENDGKITIHIDKTEDLLKCTIEDNVVTLPLLRRSSTHLQQSSTASSPRMDNTHAWPSTPLLR